MVEIIGRLDVAGVVVWLDGGWGVDALLGGQMRPHDDLDVVLAAADTEAVRDALHPLGFHAAIDESPTRIVLADAADRRIDVHLVTFDVEGGGIQRLPGGRSFRYPPEGFHGMGRIGGREVHCPTPEVQVLCHLGYAPDATDWHDVHRLCQRFGLPIPAPYRHS